MALGAPKLEIRLADMAKIYRGVVKVDSGNEAELTTCCVCPAVLRIKKGPLLAKRSVLQGIERRVNLKK